MGALGDIVDKVTSTYNSGSSLQDFLSKFSSSSGLYANIIDPYSQFDLTMKFYPTSQDEKPKGNALDRMIEGLKGTGKRVLTNAADNITGGLIGSIFNNNVKVTEKLSKNPNVGKATFLECLAAANMIVGTEDDFFGSNVGNAVSPLVLQLGPYCQNVQVPNVVMESEGTSTNALGTFPINGTIVKPDTNVFSMDIINTKIALHERIFYPWMREVTLPFWSYESQPYTTATVTVDYSKHNNVKYVFSGCRPQKIDVIQGNQGLDDSNIVRKVSFIFDFMFINTKMNSISETPKNKLVDTGKSLLGSATKMMKM